MRSVHDRIRQHLQDHAKAQGWGSLVFVGSVAGGKEMRVYETGSYRTTTLHRDGEYMVHRKLKWTLEMGPVG